MMIRIRPRSGISFTSEQELTQAKGRGCERAARRRVNWFSPMLRAVFVR